MLLDEQRRSSGLLATPKDYQNYFGVPPKTSSASDFLRWAASVTAAVTTELDHTHLTTGQRDLLRLGLAKALHILSDEGAGAVRP